LLHLPFRQSSAMLTKGQRGLQTAPYPPFAAHPPFTLRRWSTACCSLAPAALASQQSSLTRCRAWPTSSTAQWMRTMARMAPPRCSHPQVCGCIRCGITLAADLLKRGCTKAPSGTPTCASMKNLQWAAPPVSHSS